MLDREDNPPFLGRIVALRDQVSGTPNDAPGVIWEIVELDCSDLIATAVFHNKPKP